MMNAFRCKYKDNWKYKLTNCHVHTMHVRGLSDEFVDKDCQCTEPVDKGNCGKPMLTLIPGSKCKRAKIKFAKEYAWDGPSGPTADTENSMRASLVHDGLYQAMRERKLRLTARGIADKEFRRILKDDGMSFLRRWIWWLGVRCFAKGAARPVDLCGNPSQVAICNKDCN